MKHLCTLFILLFLASFTACEKALLEEQPSTEVDGSSQGGSSSKGDSSEGGSSSGSDEGSDGGAVSGNDSIGYPDGDSSEGLETDIVDGNDKDKKDDSPKPAGPMVLGEQSYTVNQFLSYTFTKEVWVVGYIVGDCTKSIKYANFDPPFTQPQAILLADDPNERDTQKVMSVQLSGTNRQNEYCLKSHPENQGTKRLAVLGVQRTYLGVPGMTSKGTGIGSIGWLDDYNKSE